MHNQHFPDQLAAVSAVMHKQLPVQPYVGSVQVGVDLGTAYLVLLVLDQTQSPIGGAYQFAQVARDGLVVDYMGAVDLLKLLKQKVEADLGLQLTHAATAYPPGVHLSEVRTFENVLAGAELTCTNTVEEPTAANTVLQIENGVVVDVGGGTTGIAVVENGQVVYTADEPTGGTHFSLVIAGAKNISFEAAEACKTDPANQGELFPLVKPVMEKVASIVQTHIRFYQVEAIYLVGGTSQFLNFGPVIEAFTGIHTIIPPQAMFVTPLGIALQDQAHSENSESTNL